jgi:hypothetical protein
MIFTHILDVGLKTASPLPRIWMAIAKAYLTWFLYALLLVPSGVVVEYTRTFPSQMPAD